MFSVAPVADKSACINSVITDPKAVGRIIITANLRDNFIIFVGGLIVYYQLTIQ